MIAFDLVADSVCESYVVVIVFASASADGYYFVDFWAHGVWSLKCFVDWLVAYPAGVVCGKDPCSEFASLVSVTITIIFMGVCRHYCIHLP